MAAKQGAIEREDMKIRRLITLLVGITSVALSPMTWAAGHGGGGFGGGGGMFGQATSSQGYVRANYGVDAAIRYEFLKNKQASLSLNVNDIFKTRRSDIHSESIYFIQDVFRRRDAQIMRLNFNWRFGKFDPNLFKRKNLKNQNDQNGIEGMGVGQ